MADSDGTILFGDSTSYGSVLTARAAAKLGRLILKVGEGLTVGEVLRWLVEQGIVVLNVAGYRESEAPRFEDRVEAFLIQTLRGIKYR